MLKYVVDIDHTICYYDLDDISYADAKPDEEMIEYLNNLYDQGNEIHYYTARGTETKTNWEELTKQQLMNWNVKYTSLKFGKPAADFYIDDKNLLISQVKQQKELEKCNTIVQKPWGVEYWLEKNPYYVVKRLVIRPGQQISLQFHKVKHETWHVIEGSGTAFIIDKEYQLKPGQTYVIPSNSVHSVVAATELHIIETSTTEVDDIVRIPLRWC